MTTKRETAKIYQFPAGGRAGFATKGKVKTFDEQPPLRVAQVVFGGSWYHEEAVSEAEQARNR